MMKKAFITLFSVLVGSCFGIATVVILSKYEISEFTKGLITAVVGITACNIFDEIVKKK